MNESIFIKFPWSEIPSNENFVTEGQIRQVYFFISNAILQKIKSEVGSSWGIIPNEISSGKLSDIKVYNKLMGEIDSQIFDPIAQEYTRQCIRAIKDCNLNKKNVAKSFYTLYSTFCRNSSTNQLYSLYLASNKKKFIDFKKLFDLCKTATLTDTSTEIKEIKTDFDAYCNKALGQIK